MFGGARPISSPFKIFASGSAFAARLLGFVGRHRWSLPLGFVSAVIFAELASEMRAGRLHALDAALAGVTARGRGPLDGAMLLLTHLGSFCSMAALAVLFALILWLAGRRKDSVFLVISAGGTGLCNAGLKVLFQRARPGATSLYLIETPSSFSFPSGHAMGSTGVLLSLLVIVLVSGISGGLKLAAILLTTGILFGIASSRVYFGVHYPSDVLAGMLAGAACVSAITGWFYPRLLPGEASRHAKARPGARSPGPGN